MFCSVRTFLEWKNLIFGRSQFSWVKFLQFYKLIWRGLASMGPWPCCSRYWNQGAPQTSHLVKLVADEWPGRKATKVWSSFHWRTFDENRSAAIICHTSAETLSSCHPPYPQLMKFETIHVNLKLMCLFEGTQVWNTPSEHFHRNN